MPKIRRRCALCDDPLPDTNPTNTCARCQAEEAGDQEAVAHVVRTVIIPRLITKRTAAIPIAWENRAGLVHCPTCGRAIINRTPICHPKNPIGDCPFGREGIPHIHSLCGCGADVVTYPQEAA